MGGRVAKSSIPLDPGRWSDLSQDTFSAFLFIKASSQEEHPALKKDSLVHTVYFGLFKQVRKWSPVLLRRKCFLWLLNKSRYYQSEWVSFSVKVKSVSFLPSSVQLLLVGNTLRIKSDISVAPHHDFQVTKGLTFSVWRDQQLACPWIWGSIWTKSSHNTSTSIFLKDIKMYANLCSLSKACKLVIK